jgi:subtilisin family serine protease
MIRGNPCSCEVGHDPTIVRVDGRLALCVLWRVLATERASTSGRGSRSAAGTATSTGRFASRSTRSGVTRTSTSSKRPPIRKPLSLYTIPYGISMVQATDVWSAYAGVNGSGKKVCVIDSGLAVDHDRACRPHRSHHAATVGRDDSRRSNLQRRNTSRDGS